MTAPRVRFLTTDPMGLWTRDEEADDLGWESSHPAAPRIRCLRLSTGEVICLTDPFIRGLITPIPS